MAAADEDTVELPAIPSEATSEPATVPLISELINPVAVDVTAKAYMVKYDTTSDAQMNVIVVATSPKQASAYVEALTGFKEIRIPPAPVSGDVVIPAACIREGIVQSE